MNKFEQTIKNCVTILINDYSCKKLEGIGLFEDKNGKESFLNIKAYKVGKLIRIDLDGGLNDE